MNRSYLIATCLFGLGAVTVLTADEVTASNPAAPAAPAPAVSTALPAAPAPSFTEPQILEAYGWLVGKQLGLAELGFGKDQVDIFIKGLLAAAGGQTPPYELDKIRPQLEGFMQKKQEAFLTRLRDKNLGEAKAFFENLRENKSVVELPDGLRYEVVKPGAGAYPKATSTVKVHYTGTLLNGTVIDSSVERGQPVEFALNQVIPGWTEGLQKINQGGKIRLYIPPQLAYGDSGQQGVPPGAALIFDIELLEIKAPAPAAAPAVAAPAPAAPETKP